MAAAPLMLACETPGATETETGTERPKMASVHARIVKKISTKTPRHQAQPENRGHKSGTVVISYREGLTGRARVKQYVGAADALYADAFIMGLETLFSHSQVPMVMFVWSGEFIC